MGGLAKPPSKLKYKAARYFNPNEHRFPPTYTLTMSTIDHDLKDKSSPGSDVNYVESNAAFPSHSLQRQLKNRHVAMIRYFRLLLGWIRIYVKGFPPTT